MTDEAREVRSFFVLAFALTWTPQIVALLGVHGVIAGAPERLMPLAGLGAFGPILAAVVVASRSGAGWRSPLRPFLARRGGPLFYVLALLLPGAILAACMALVGLVSGRDVQLFFPPSEGPRLVALVLIPICEEVGWRGFAYPRMRRRYGVLPASLLLGAVWALWHLPMLALAGVPQGALLLALPFFVAGEVIFTWIYERTGGSLLAVILAHAGAHLSNSHLALPGDVTPFAAHTAGLLVVAAALALADRGALPMRPAVAPEA